MKTFLILSALSFSQASAIGPSFSCNRIFEDRDWGLSQHDTHRILTGGDPARLQREALDFISQKLLPTAPPAFFYLLSTLAPLYAALDPDPRRLIDNPLERDLSPEAIELQWQRVGLAALAEFLNDSEPKWVEECLIGAPLPVKSWLSHALLDVPKLEWIAAAPPSLSWTRHLTRWLNLTLIRYPQQRKLRALSATRLIDLHPPDQFRLLVIHSRTAQALLLESLAKCYGETYKAAPPDEARSFHDLANGALRTYEDPFLPQTELQKSFRLALDHILRDRRVYIDGVLLPTFRKLLESPVGWAVASHAKQAAKEKSFSSWQKRMRLLTGAAQILLTQDQIKDSSHLPFMFSFLMANLFPAEWPHPEWIIEVMVAGLRRQVHAMKQNPRPEHALTDTPMPVLREQRSH